MWRCRFWGLLVIVVGLEMGVDKGGMGMMVDVMVVVLIFII